MTIGVKENLKLARPLQEISVRDPIFVMNDAVRDALQQELCLARKQLQGTDLGELLTSQSMFALTMKVKSLEAMLGDAAGNCKAVKASMGTGYAEFRYSSAQLNCKDDVDPDGEEHGAWSERMKMESRWKPAKPKATPSSSSGSMHQAPPKATTPAPAPAPASVPPRHQRQPDDMDPPAPALAPVEPPWPSSATNQFSFSSSDRATQAAGFWPSLSPPTEPIDLDEMD